jgi:hypothetical protein
VFHGQGGRPDTAKADKQAYCAAIDKSVSKWLGQSTRPLLLACVGSLADIYRNVNSYKHLLAQTMAGNHDHRGLAELRKAAIEFATPFLDKGVTEVATKFRQLSGTRLASDELGQVLAAASQGRAEYLLYDPAAEVYGKYDAASGHVDVTGEENHADLVDIAAIQTLMHGGTIHATGGEEAPSSQPLAVLLRY